MIRHLAPAAVLAASLVVPTLEAQACGGFFCSTERIDQSKERIVFGIDNDKGEVTSHVQIFFEGEADEFAWVVPVPSDPDIGLSSDSLFTQLEWRTAPTFNLEWQEVGDCVWDYWGRGGGFGAPEAFDTTASVEEDGASNDVVVVAERQVGPYDQVTLQASDAGALLTWLQDNDYDIPDEVGKNLQPYVAERSFFVALKLTNDSDAGDIAPIRMTYKADAAMIPLVLTAIAATPDMRLQPYVFSDKRAVPDNYLHVQINEAAIDWLGWGSNYDDVITKAANEAGGQAFATDYAGPTEPFRGMLYEESRFDLDALRNTSDPGQFVSMMLGQGFPRSMQVQGIIREFIPMPQAAVDAGIDEQWFYNCLGCHPEYVAMVDFDPSAMVAALEERVVVPLRDAEALFTDHSYLTRMTSSMSPEEMTLDPYFVLNPDMPEVANNRMATLVVDCGDGMNLSEANRTIVLEDGREILVPPEAWFWENNVSTLDFVADLDETAAMVIEKTSATGVAEILSDQSSFIDEAIDDHNSRVRELLGIEEPTDGQGCGCASSTGGLPFLPGFALLFGLVRRRRS